MNNRIYSITTILLVLVLLAGCGRKSDNQTENKPSNQPSSAQAVQPSPAPPVAEAPSTPPPPPPAPAAVKRVQPPPPRPKPVVLNAGTTLTVRLDQAISAKTAQPGQTFTAAIATPIAINGKTVVPKGSEAEGTVVQAKSAGKIKGEGALSIALKTLTVHGVTYPIQAEPVTVAQKGKGSRTAKIGGGSAAGGALIGGIAGGGKGALIGGLVGGGAGVAGSALTGNKALEFPAESAVSFRLSEPLTLKPGNASPVENAAATGENQTNPQ